MGSGRHSKRSDLFLVRVWVSEAGDGDTEFRGKVQRAVNGEERYFHDLPELADVLRSMMPVGPTRSGIHVKDSRSAVERDLGGT